MTQETKSEFEKARDEISIDYAANESVPHGKRIAPAWEYANNDFQNGADWAYEWCRKKETVFDMYLKDRSALETKLQIAVEALEKARTNKAIESSMCTTVNTRRLDDELLELETALAKIKGDT